MPATWASTSVFSPDRPAKRPVGAVALPPGIGAERQRPRASAHMVPVCCGTSATAGTSGRRPWRVPVATAWTSAPAGSIRNSTTTVRTVFRCVASRNRGVGAQRILPSSRARPNPLGENQSLSSPPLKPRGLLLSVMRQKVGKERSQEVFAPLANPRFFRTTPPEKVRPVAHPLRLCKTPVGVPSGTAEAGDSTNRNLLCPTKLGQDLPMTARRLPPRRVRNIRFAHLHPRRRRTEKPLRPIVIFRTP